MITTLLNADMLEMEKEDEEGRRCQEWAFKHPRLYELHCKLAMYWYSLLEVTLCKWFGHALVDDGSYATPDSGGEGQMCTRCGHSWWHQYY